MATQFSVEWKPQAYADTTADNSAKTFVCPAGFYYQFLGVYINYASTVTAGNRLVSVLGKSGAGDVLCSAFSSVTQAASLTYQYSFNIANPYITSLRSTTSIAPMPMIILKPGDYIEVIDDSSIDPTADDMSVYYSYLARKV